MIKDGGTLKNIMDDNDEQEDELIESIGNAERVTPGQQRGSRYPSVSIGFQWLPARITNHNQL